MCECLSFIPCILGDGLPLCVKLGALAGIRQKGGQTGAFRFNAYIYIQLQLQQLENCSRERQAASNRSWMTGSAPVCTAQQYDDRVDGAYVTQHDVT